MLQIYLIENAITYAKAKAIKHHIKLYFIVGNVLQMDRLSMEGEFDTIIDSGLFRMMTDEERPVFARQIHRVLKSGGKYFMLSFSDKEPEGYGPRRILKAEIERTFTPLLNIIYTKNSAFNSRVGSSSIKPYFVSAIKS